MRLLVHQTEMLIAAHPPLPPPQNSASLSCLFGASLPAARTEGSSRSTHFASPPPNPVIYLIDVLTKMSPEFTSVLVETDWVHPKVAGEEGEERESGKWKHAALVKWNGKWLPPSDRR